MQSVSCNSPAAQAPRQVANMAMLRWLPNSLRPCLMLHNRSVFAGQTILHRQQQAQSSHSTCSYAAAWPCQKGKSHALKLAASATDSSVVAPTVTLEALRWDHTFVRDLPGDSELKNNIRQVHGALFSFVSPTPTPSEPYLVAYSPEVCALLDLDPSECERPEFPLVMSGAAPLPGSKTYAQCYGGHQFGMWAGQLGDGRAITLGEVLNSRGERWELQLKGAGRTPYSRRADGRAVMRSSVREFVCSEAMHHLGIPTTRALSLVGTGDEVMRDMFYNGNAKWEPGAVVCRVSPSFVRFGTFQLPAARGPEESHLVRLLADYVIRHHYPHLEGSRDKYMSLLIEVIERSAQLVAAWQSVGFVHGVLNTDNMSILGLTIDYGPFGFLDRFDPHYTPNLTDASGRRYSFRNQPEAVSFNLSMLASALVQAELIERQAAQEVLGLYSTVLTDAYNQRMANKLGLSSYDKALSVQLLQNMYEDACDFTNTFRSLSSVSQQLAEASDADDMPHALASAITYDNLSPDRQAAWQQWLRVYRARLQEDPRPAQERQRIQDAANPKFIPRQHLLQYAIEAAERGEFGELHALMAVLRQPYDEQPTADPKYSSPPPLDMVRPGVCMLSCSS